MKALVNTVCIVCLLGLLVYPRVKEYVPFLDTDSVEVVKPVNTYGFDTTIPSVVSDDVVARQLTGLFHGLADEVEHDGTRTEPEIKYVANIRDILAEAVNIKFDGKKLNQVSSGLGDTIGPVFEKEFPDGMQELDQAQRTKAVELFRAVAYGCSLVD